MKKTLLVMLLVLALVSMFALAGCGQTTDTGTEEPATDQGTETGDDPAAAGDTSWADIQAKGYIVFGHSDSYPPMTFFDESNTMTGFDIDMAKAVCKYLGLEFRDKTMDWDSKLIVLNDGTIDAIWCGFSVTPEREEQVYFTTTYMNCLQSIITRADSDINTKADLAGKVLAWQMGSSGENAILADPIYAELKGEKTYNTMPDALMDLVNGRVDAVVIDSIYFAYYGTKEGVLDKYKELSDNFGTEPLAVGVRKGDITFGEKLNEALIAVMHSQEGVDISMKWFSKNVFEGL